MLSLSTHILDTTKGKPAENVTVKLFKYVDYTWMESNTIGRTDDNGRIREFSKIDEEIFGTYKLRFEVDEYFKRQHIVDALYPYIEIVFDINKNEHYHIPLLLTAFSYSTYRGS